MNQSITIQVADPMVQFEFDAWERPQKITKREAADLYSRGLFEFNKNNNTDLDIAMFLLSPTPEQMELQSISWGTAVDKISRWTMTILPEGKAAVQSSLQSTVSAAVTEAVQIQSEIWKQEMENAVSPLNTRITLLEKEVVVLKNQLTLAAPMILRKIVYKGRQVLIEKIAPGTACTVENFTAWLAQQDRQAVLSVVSDDQLEYLSKWGTTDGDTVAHYEFLEENSILAAAVEALEDGLSKDIIRSVFSFSFGGDSKDMAQQRIISVDVTKPGKALIGKGRSLGKTREPSFPTLPSPRVQKAASAVIVTASKN